MAIYPNAIYRGPIPNKDVGGMIHPVRGLVVHIEQGTEDGTDGWFHNAKAQASAHFGVYKDGRVHQWVDTNDKAWAEAMGNPNWFSVENEGNSGESLTPQQVESIAKLFVWLSKLEGFPLRESTNPAVSGLGHHAMGGAGWGGHLDCPGNPIIAQKAQIVARANQVVNPIPSPEVKPMFNPPLQIVAWKLFPEGLIGVGPDGGIFCEPGSIYAGGPNGKPYWAGHSPALVDSPNAAEAAAGKKYVIVDTKNNRYAYPE